MRASYALENRDSTLYFKKYNWKWNSCDEFRIFVHNKQITAISPYIPEFNHYSEMPDTELEKLVDCMIKFWENEPSRKNIPQSHTMDIHVTLREKDLDPMIELIEYNSFGYWSPAGSGLFDWIDDYSILYGETTSPSITLRLANLE